MTVIGRVVTPTCSATCVHRVCLVSLCFRRSYFVKGSFYDFAVFVFVFAVCLTENFYRVEARYSPANSHSKCIPGYV